MTPLSYIIAFIVIIVITILILALLHEFYFTKWRRAYHFTYVSVANVMFTNDRITEYRDSIKYSLMFDFNLTPEQAQECIDNWNNKYWFKEQTFLQ